MFLLIRREERGCRQGYMGHLIRMANQIAGNPVPMGINMGSLTRNNGYEENRLQEDLDEETFIKWSEFISGPLIDINKKNSSNLVSNGVICVRVCTGWSFLVFCGLL